MAACSNIHSLARIHVSLRQSGGKSGCVRLGGICNSSSECCGNNDPVSGHCVVCNSFWTSLTGRGHDKCACIYHSATVHRNTQPGKSKACNGPDRSGKSVCRVYDTPPDKNDRRGKKPV
ncbi:unnamed protein product [Rotaria sp. Silwood1]|nr:unnamed protein product [Rotaria sp. Silwood1]CAF1630093.1 unnamed protein product [Rotaria sp. Silwood1]CAF3791691.1 unnamed protein product [Rotaria sp. Silwood1]CAF4819940.1 unnamed protein product [Rotaria sp. Silwood1]